MADAGSVLRGILTFPETVNDVSARLVASMVVTVSMGAILTDYSWLMVLLAYGFLARVLAGPTLSPMGLLATRVLTPMLGSPGRAVPGPPKRFAQAVGLVFSVIALVLYFLVGATAAAKGVLGLLALFAFLEAGFGFCAGCALFGYLMRRGVIPESVCPECAVAPSAAQAD